MGAIKSKLKLCYCLLVFVCANALHAQVSQKEYDNAMQVMNGSNQKAATDVIENLAKKYPTDAKVNFIQGIYHLRSGNNNSALQFFTKAITTNPKFVDAYNGRAVVFEEKGMLEKSIDDLNKSIELESNNVQTINMRARLHYKLELYPAALQDFNKLIQINPNSIVAYLDAANTTLKISDAKTAETYFTKAINANIPKGRVFIYYGSFLLQQEKYTEAKQKYEIALQEAENEFYDDDYNKACIVFYKNKEYTKAIQLAEKAIKINGKKTEYYHNLASCYIDLQDWQQVTATAERALLIDREDKMSNMYMAVGLTRQGKTEQAQPYSNKAKQ